MSSFLASCAVEGPRRFEPQTFRSLDDAITYTFLEQGSDLEVADREAFALGEDGFDEYSWGVIRYGVSGSNFFATPNRAAVEQENGELEVHFLWEYSSSSSSSRDVFEEGELITLMEGGFIPELFNGEAAFGVNSSAWAVHYPIANATYGGALEGCGSEDESLLFADLHDASYRPLTMHKDIHEGSIPWDADEDSLLVRRLFTVDVDFYTLGGVDYSADELIDAYCER